MLAISTDDVESHCRFAEKLGGLDFPHFADTGLAATNAYRVVNDRGNGSKRTIFVVDRAGILQHVNLAYSVGDEGQYQAIFDALARIP